ncbi:hypothetical protein PILCRDRAFT_1651 [Piloderma croceum F 1598]|uniref:Uncharacterized protein n=1 Tax=Piloderma croceum (strain F 1598) TaxID=765440 RepID=A0A0C3GF73_PILCF|nr:hypothetical protein PILCRDRAFT_1651 [Piloderma croceum F 1598]
MLNVLAKVRSPLVAIYPAGFSFLSHGMVEYYYSRITIIPHFKTLIDELTVNAY